MQSHVRAQQWQGKRIACILSGANMNFHSLRHVSERCELGEKREAVLAVTIPERKGAYLAFVEHLGGRAVTEFNYRYSGGSQANIFAGIRIGDDESALPELLASLRGDEYLVDDLSDDEMAKLHVRYMVGGKPKVSIEERLFSFEFPEQPGALLKFLRTLGSHWNITLFHYRNHGAAYGRVLAGFEARESDACALRGHLDALGFDYKEETDNPAYRLFLA